jgi:hypothetical protein
MLLDHFDQFGISVLGTQELRVGLRSVKAVLRRGCDGRDHFALAPVEVARPEHDLPEEDSERWSQSGVRADQSGHGGQKAKVIWPSAQAQAP